MRAVDVELRAMLVGLRLAAQRASAVFTQDPIEVGPHDVAHVGADDVFRNAPVHARVAAVGELKALFEVDVRDRERQRVGHQAQAALVAALRAARREKPGRRETDAEKRDDPKDARAQHVGQHGCALGAE